MTDDQSASSGLRVSSRTMLVGGALMGAGAVIGLAGFAISGSALIAAMRRWAREMEEPPADLAKRKWEQAKAATTAGASAWHGGNSAHQHRAHT
jgi:hypothetical protein